MRKRSIIWLLLLSLVGGPSVSAQTLPAVLLEDFAGQAVPHTSSGLINRLIGEVMTAFNLESSDGMFLDDTEGESRFQVTVPIDEDVSVSFYTGQSTHEAGFFIYQQVASHEPVAFDRLRRLVELVDASISEEDLQEVYDQWLEDLAGTQTLQLGNHVVTTYPIEKEGQELVAFEVLYEYFNSVFEDEAVEDRVTTFYDASGEFTNIYAPDYADNQEEVFVNRVFINRILQELSQTFGFDVSPEHLTTMGNTVYYYPEELAAFGRLNEFYIFSGQTGQDARIELRFTLGHEAKETPAMNHLQKQKRSFFYFFAKLLDPDLTDNEIEQAFLDITYEEVFDYRLGRLIIQTEGYTDETISMARLLRAEEIEAVFPNSVTSVSEEQANQVILPEEEYHLASVEKLANPEKIYAPFEPYKRLDSGSGQAMREFEELSKARWKEVPNYKSVVTMTGDVLSSQLHGNWLELTLESDDFFENYYVYLPEVDLNISGSIEVTGKNLGMQHSDSGLNLSVLAESIKQDGQVIYQAGGEQDE